MNKHIFVFPLAFAVTLFFLSGVSHAAMEEELVKKTDNFIFFIDHSSSMARSYADGQKKIVLAKDLADSMNQKIPDLDYKSGVYTFAPYQSYLPMTPYDQYGMGHAVKEINTDYSIIWRNTPMGNGLADLSSVLNELEGDVDVIMFTDGGNNAGRDPIGQARSMKETFGDKLCFHVVDFSQSRSEKKTVGALSKISDCTVMASAQSLTNDAAMEQFVNDVIFERKMTYVAPPPAPEPEPAPEPVEEEVIILRGINFDFDKAEIKPEFEPILDEAVEVLKERQDIEVIIEGHTDSTGPEAYNQKLSERRANSVKEYFVEHGISAARLETVGYGENRPAFDNTTSEGRAQNRRVELNVK